LGVGHDLAVGCVNTGVVSVLGVAGFEDVVLGIVGSVVSASNAVEDVLAIVSRVGTSGVAGLEAEGVGANEAIKGLVGACGSANWETTYLVHSIT